MREIVRNADLPEPDEVRYEFDPNEVVLMWNEPKLAVVINLEDDGTGEIEFRSEEEGQPATGLGGRARRYNVATNVAT